MFKRLFFAVNLSEKVREELFQLQEEIKDSLDRGVKWIPKEHLHVTLSFLGTVREEKIPSILLEVEKIKTNPFDIAFQKISYIPPEKENARMIWAVGESEGLIELQQKLGKAIGLNVREKEFTPHVTMGRIKSWDFRSISFDQIPDIEKEIDLAFKVSSFELMESKLKKGGPVYNLIKSFPVK